MEKLLLLLTDIAELSNSLVYHLNATVKQKTFSKGEYILKEGQICSHIYFLETGLIRIFDQQDDIENTSWLLKEGDIFISVASFFNQQPAEENIVALENCICWGISYRQLEDTCQTFPEFDLYRRILTERYYCKNQQRNKILTRLPEDRYAYVVQNEPELLSRAPLHLFPSYLNMSQSSFDRIRKRYSIIKRKGF